MHAHASLVNRNKLLWRSILESEESAFGVESVLEYKLAKKGNNNIYVIPWLKKCFANGEE